MKKYAIVMPISERITLAPSIVAKLVSIMLCTETEMTIEELGYIGTSVWLNDNKKAIVSKFRFSNLSSKNKFEPINEINKWIHKLEGKFFAGKIDNYIYDVDRKSGTIVIKWHTDLILACITDTSLLDKQYKITHVPITKSVNKKDHTPIIINIDRSHQSNGKQGYSTSEVAEYFRTIYNII